MKGTHLITMVRLILFTLLMASCSTLPHGSLVTVEEVAKTTEPHVEEPFVDINDYTLNIVDKKSSANLQVFVKELKTKTCSNKDYCQYIPQKGVEKASYKKRFEYADLKKTQSLSFENNLNILRKIKSKDLEHNAGKFMQGQCPRRTTAAVAQRLEFSNWDLSEKLFNYSQECGADAELESLYVRYALMNYAEGHKEKAQELIKKALEIRSADAPRSLYWAAIILNNNSYISELKDKYPYSFHAVKYAQDNHEDLFKKISAKSWVIPERRDNDLNKYLEVLLKKDMDADAYSLLNANLDSLVKNDIKNLFYLMKLFAIQSREDYTVRLVSKIGYKYPETLNTQLLSFSYKMAYLDKFKGHSVKEGDDYLFLSLSKQESGFYAQAKSKSNARGLMQLLPSTARHISKTKSKDLYNVDNNIELGTKYFYSLYNQYNSVEKALAAYNAGPGNVNKWQATYKAKNPVLFMDTIPIKETRNYVSSILKFNYFYVKMAEEFKTNNKLVQETAKEKEKKF